MGQNGNGDKLQTKIDVIAENAWLKLLGRATMVMMVPAFVWFGTTLIELRSDFRLLQEQVLVGTDKRYRSDDAVRDQAIQKERSDRIERKFDDWSMEFKRRLEKLEERK